jgi:hypothetical protein
VGQVIDIPHGSVLFCPVAAVKHWLAVAGIEAGPLFRAVGKGSRVGQAALSDKSVANRVKHYAEKVGLEAADFAAHSLRAGFVTSAAEAGASIFKMAEAPPLHRCAGRLRALGQSVQGPCRGRFAVSNHRVINF